MNTPNKFDVIVIGAGSGGLNIASFMNRVGLKVLLVDRSAEHIGGDCLNFGCIPSKALLHVARTVHQVKQAGAFGYTVTGQADWSAVRAYIKSKQDVIRAHESVEWFESKGITVALGTATFLSKNTIVVDGVEYQSKKIVLATGSRPRALTGHGIERVARVLNNENIFTMESLPQRLLVIGGGPIGIEVAQALSHLGSTVTVVDPGAQILGKEDAGIAKVVLERMELDGVRFLLGHTLKEFVTATEAQLTSKDGVDVTVSYDAVFVGVGRVPNTEGLDLKTAGIEVDAAGKIVVDEYLRTTNKNVFLCGDIAGNYQFTHAAEMHAAVILKNFFSLRKKKFVSDSISWVTYTTPEVATYGLQEAQLQKRNIAYQTLVTDMTEDDRAITDGYEYGLAKMFIAKDGQILGGTMVAPQAGELIQELVLAQTHNMSVQELFNKTYAYPVASRINKRMIANYVAKRLTPRVNTLLRFLYRFL